MNVSFKSLLANLENIHEPLKSTLLYRLSAPRPEDFEAFKAIWANVPVERRRLLFARMLEAAEESFELDFRQVAVFGLTDEDEEVRRLAIANLWEDTSLGLMERLLDILANDTAEQVRSEAAQSLGRYVLLGELGKCPEEQVRWVEEALLIVCESGDDTLEVQRRSLESAAYSGRDEVPPLIEDAYHHSEPKMRASALFAMGRSADRRWARYVLTSLDDTSAEMRYEAVRAAGELELEEALPRLIELMMDSDREVMEAAIWSVGMVGGTMARRALVSLSQRIYDEELLEIIEDAIGLTVLSGEDFGLNTLDLDDDDYDYSENEE